MTLPADAAPAPQIVDLEWALELNQQPIVPELLEGAAEPAIRQLAETSRTREWGVSPGAWESLRQSLLQVLARLTNLVILQRFSGFRLILNPLWRANPVPPGDAPNGRRELLDAYIEWELGERLFTEGSQYPEFARLANSAIRNWSQCAVEMLGRVQQHRRGIADLCGCEEERLGPLTAARFGISDPHCRGRSAAILSFGASKVLYKPRPLDAEAGWSDIFERVIAASLNLDVHRLRVVRGDGFGFMEFIPGKACETLDSVRRCYCRYGALTAVAHALGTFDLHHENVIVTGEYPVVIDAEPLFHARLAVSEQGQQRLKHERNLSIEGLTVRESVLELGILPLRMSTLPAPGQESRQEYEIGALCAYGGSSIPTPVVCGRGSDDLQLRYLPVQSTRFPNLPSWNGTPCLPADFLDEIIEGFKAAHQFLRSHRETFLASGGPLDRLASAPVRLLARPTMDYSTVLTRSLSPEHLRSSDARLNLIRSDLEFLAATRFDTIADLADAEIASLCDGDIPRFELRAKDLECGVRLLSSPLDSARARWSGLDEFDGELQTASIRERILCREKRIVLPAESPSASALEDHVSAIISTIVAAVQSPYSDPWWAYAAFAPGFSATMAHADRESLYEGAAGTAVAIAEAGAILRRRDWLDLACRVFGPILRGGVPQCVRRSGGLGRGLGGLIYALARVSGAAQSEALLDTAVRLALRFGPDLAQSDRLDEVLYGRAGLLLALLALEARRPMEQLRRLADAAARNLILHARPAAAGVCWPVPGGRSMPNVSHGAAGIAMALARYARLRGDEVAAETARQALVFDDSFWLTDEQGWIDARVEKPPGEPRTTWAWCNGRSGALVARLAVAEALDRPFDTDLVAAALRAPASGVLSESAPGLCCGTAGAVDSLLCIRDRSRTDVVSPLIHQAVDVLATKTSVGNYSPLAGNLFSGVAGHAFALLRAARPADVAPIVWFA